jgi:hypothetical protein
MPVLITASTWEVDTGLVPEDRACARSVAPEARSAARRRGRAIDLTPDGLVDRWPALASVPVAVRWLEVQRDLGRSPQPVLAYTRSLADYLAWCEGDGVEVLSAGRADIAGYLRDLRERPGRRGANVISLSSRIGLSNATPQLRVVGAE